MKNQQGIRIEFAHYFLALQESQNADGATVSKSDEWERFIEHKIEEGDLTEDARRWKCPRSLKAKINN